MTDVRFGIAVDSDNGIHVRFRLFAATGGRHLGGCGQLVMRKDEYDAFRELLVSALAEHSDPPAPAPVENCNLCRHLGHAEGDHPLPKDHPQYDAFYDATDDELSGMLATAIWEV